MRIVTLLEINSRLIKICESLRSTVPPQNLQTDPTHTGYALGTQLVLICLDVCFDYNRTWHISLQSLIERIKLSLQNNSSRRFRC